MSLNKNGVILSNGYSIETLHEIASSEPKISEDDPRITNSVAFGELIHEKFKNNFYLRFNEIRAVIDNSANDTQKNYIRMVKERFAVDLIGFYRVNTELCDDIFSAIDAKSSYDLLISSREELGALEYSGKIALGSVVELEKAANHPIGIESIGVYYWDKLNPMLEVAYDKISETTLNAPYFSY